VRNATADVERCTADAQSAAVTAEATRQAARQAEADRRQAELARKQAVDAKQGAEVRAAGATADFAKARAELSPQLAAQAAPIAAVGFPSALDAAQARETGRQVQSRTRAHDDWRNRRQERDQTAETIRTLLQAVSAVGAPADMTAAQAHLTELEAQLKELKRQRIDADKQRNAAELSERQLEAKARAAADAVTELAGELGRAEAEAQGKAQARMDAEHALPADALSWEPTALATELQQLEGANVESEFATLAKDRAEQGLRESQLADAERQIEERVPADARRPSPTLAPEVSAAELAVQQAEQARDAARRQAEELARQRQAREDAQEKLAAAEQRYSMHDRLSGLLGPEVLQLELVRDAECRIIELASETLGRVSCGELRFEPPNPAGKQAFDLRVHRTGCPEPIPSATCQAANAAGSPWRWRWPSAAMPAALPSRCNRSSSTRPSPTLTAPAGWR